MIIRWLACLLAVMFLIGCSHMGFARREMTGGERLFRANCRSCHVLPDPKEHGHEEWPELVARYGERIDLPAESQQLIVEYLQTVLADSSRF